MQIPNIHSISQEEFEKADDIFKIIVDSNARTYVSFTLNNRKYYISYSSSEIIKVDMMVLEKENYLLIGVDLKAVVLSTTTGAILFSIGLFSYFKGFKDKDDLSFVILSELDDLVIGKNKLHISQIIPHQLEF